MLPATLTQLPQPLLGLALIIALTWTLIEDRRRARPRLIIGTLAIAFSFLQRRMRDIQCLGKVAQGHIRHAGRGMRPVRNVSPEPVAFQ